MDTNPPPPPVGNDPQSDSGPRFQVEVPTLKSLYIESRYGDTVLGSATAILAANDREAHCALITNRHVVTGRHQDDGTCLNKNGGIPDNIVIYFHRNDPEIGEWKQIKLPLYRTDGTPFWIEHPRLGKAADVVALNLTGANDVRRLPYYLRLNLDRLEMLVSPAEPVSVIGFPFGLSSAARFPLWATGFLAQELSLVTPDNPVFLIDCRTRPGQSGAAVIAHRSGSHRKQQDGKIQSVLTGGTVWEFLGVYSGRVNAQSDLGKVWHVGAIEELLAAAETDMKTRTAAHLAAQPK